MLLSQHAHADIGAALHEDGISFHHLCRAVEGEAIQSVDKVFVQHVQVLHLLHRRVEQ